MVGRQLLDIDTETAVTPRVHYSSLHGLVVATHKLVSLCATQTSGYIVLRIHLKLRWFADPVHQTHLCLLVLTLLNCKFSARGLALVVTPWRLILA
jgi:hypothetical protein